MAEDPSSVDRARQRGSWARAFDKVKQAMKRRPSSSTGVPLPPPHETPSQETADTALRTTEPTTRSIQSASQDDNDTLTPAPLSTLSPGSSADLLAADTALDADTEDDLDEPLLPMLPSRTGISHDKARDLFAKYGLQYETRSKRLQQEPPHKIRRVERPIRLRVHWTCHSCRTQFGIDKICISCGHRRCRECYRHPPKRVRELSDVSTRQMEYEESQSQHEVASVPDQSLVMGTSVSTDPDLLQYQSEPPATPERLSQHPRVTQSPAPEPETPSQRRLPTTSAPTVPGSPTAQPLELDESRDDGQEEEEKVALPMIQQYSIYTRPRTSVQAMLEPNAQSVRRTCHKCDTQMMPPSRRDCQSCGHVRCDLCPRYPPNYEKPSSRSPHELPGERVPTYTAVQRVYRKPRQRVRYTCELCSTLFITGDRCGECGHERCHTCHREPPKRSHSPPDPELLRSVANRLATYGDWSQSPGITASG